MATYYNENSNWNKDFRTDIRRKLSKQEQYIFYIGYERICENNVFNIRASLKITMRKMIGDNVYYDVLTHWLDQSGRAVEVMRYTGSMNLYDYKTEEEMYRAILEYYDEIVFNQAYNFVHGNKCGMPVYPRQFVWLTKKQMSEIGYKHMLPKANFVGAKTIDVQISKLK